MPVAAAVVIIVFWPPCSCVLLGATAWISESAVTGYLVKPGLAIRAATVPTTT